MTDVVLRDEEAANFMRKLAPHIHKLTQEKPMAGVYRLSIAGYDLEIFQKSIRHTDHTVSMMIQRIRSDEHDIWISMDAHSIEVPNDPNFNFSQIRYPVIVISSTIVEPDEILMKLMLCL